jgi:hypothetical protein
MFRWVGSLIIALFALARLTQYGLAQTTVDTATYPDGVKFLDQNWSHDERLEYYYTSQGSAALRYGIFVAVEQADTQDLFRSDANLARPEAITDAPIVKSRPVSLACPSIGHELSKATTALTHVELASIYLDIILHRRRVETPRTGT